MKKNQKKRFKYIVSLLPVLTMMGVIFLFSSKTADQSNGSSSSIAISLTDFYYQIFGGSSEVNESSALDTVNHIVRKGAHITEYASLAFLLAIHLFVIGVKKKKFLWLNSGICVLYAMSDEFHQTFVQGRSGQISDVGIDSIGILISTLLFYLFFYSNAEKSNQMN